MGEIADDMIEGDCCSWCMQYFVTGHGYPVLCKSCWNEASKEDRAGLQQATEKEA
jgi:hypothetical protein